MDVEQVDRRAIPLFPARQQRVAARLPLYEWVRLYAGFSLPVLLIQHAVTVRLGASLYGYDATYRNVVSTIVATGSQGWQLALLAPGWMHGCMGLWLNLRRFAWARHAKPLLNFVRHAPPSSIRARLRQDGQRDRARSFRRVFLLRPRRRPRREHEGRPERLAHGDATHLSRDDCNSHSGGILAPPFGAHAIAEMNTQHAGLLRASAAAPRRSLGPPILAKRITRSSACSRTQTA